METRSNMSIETARFQPWFTSPRRFAAGMRASLKNTSLKPRAPEIWTSGRTSIPGARMSTMNMDSPWCLGSVGSVRATTIPKSQ